MNKDKLTTAAGTIAALPQILGVVLPLFGLAIPVEVLNSITAIGLFVLGFFTNKA
jgi:hypothetical protein